MAEDVILTEEQKKAKALEHLSGKKPDAPVKTQEEIDAEKKVEDEKVLAEAKKIEEADALALAEEEKKKKKEDPAKVEMTDAELMEAVAKRSGRKIASWDELKPAVTEEDKKKEQEKRDSDKLSFGLKKGLFNTKLYESFIADSKNTTELVYGRELAEAKADDPEWNDEKEKEFKEEFDEKFGLNLDPTASKNKRGKKQLSLIAESILQKEYAPIYQLDAAYSSHENEMNSREAQKQKILTGAPIYKADADAVISTFSKIEVEFGDEKFEVPVSKEMSDALSEVMLDNNFSASHILNGYKKEALTEFARQYLIGQNFQALAFEAAKKYREKHEKGVRGIPAGGKMEQQNDGNDQLTEKQKTAIGYLKGEPAQVAN